MRWRTLLTIGILALLPCFVEAQVKSADTGAVELPRERVHRVPSPNHRWTLIFGFPDYRGEWKLWVEDNTSHTRKLVKEHKHGWVAAWAPDGERFFVSNEYDSNGWFSYVIDPATLKTTDLSELIVHNDGEAAQLLKAGDSFVGATRWLNSHELLVFLYVHYDGSPLRPNPDAFSIKYRVDLNGSVRKILEHPVEEP